MISTAACPVRKHTGIGAFIAAAALTFSLMLAICLPAQALAATNEKTGFGSSSVAGAISEASAKAAKAHEKLVDPTTRVLPYNAEAVAGVETQVSTGHTSCCLAFSQALGDTMMTGETVDHTEFAHCGNCAWSPCASYGEWTANTYDLADVYHEINAGRPCVLHVAGWGSSEHWVIAFGYVGVEDPNEMTFDNLYIIDPWDGEVMIASERFYSQGDVRLSERADTVLR